MLSNDTSLNKLLKYNYESSQALCKSLNACAAANMAQDFDGVDILETLCLGLMERLEQIVKHL